VTITVSSEINRLFSCFGSVIALIWPRIFFRVYIILYTNMSYRRRLTSRVVVLYDDD